MHLAANLGSKSRPTRKKWNKKDMAATKKEEEEDVAVVVGIEDFFEEDLVGQVEEEPSPPVVGAHDFLFAKT